MREFAADLQFRGLVHQVTDPALFTRLDQDRVTVYAGFDPSAPSLHVGSLLQLCTLRRFQLAGHRPIALAGGGTGMIGDPGGKAAERRLLSADQLAQNVEGIRTQLAKFVDLDPARRPAPALLLDNSAWLGTLPVIEFLRDVGKHFTVNQMVAKESVRTRFERPEQGISYTEFSYMLLQAYDFLRLHLDHGCEVQFGGSDQWGNITVGVELLRKTLDRHVYGFTTPLVTKADGTKFGKTESDNVWLDPARTSPYKLHQFLLQAEDEVVGDYLRYFTFLSHEQILALDGETAARPERRSAQRVLANEVCALVHGEGEARRAEQAGLVLFDEANDEGELAALDERTLLEVVEDAPSSVVAREKVVGAGLALVDVLHLSELATSRSAARRLIEQGGVYVNNRREKDVDRVLVTEDLLHGRYVLLRRGRREYHLLRVE